MVVARLVALEPEIANCVPSACDDGVKFCEDVDESMEKSRARDTLLAALVASADVENPAGRRESTLAELRISVRPGGGRVPSRFW